MTQIGQGAAGHAPSDRAVPRASRRALLRGGLGVVGSGVLAAVGGRALSVYAQSDAGATPAGAPTSARADVAIFPRHGTRTASPGTEITFRGLPADALGSVTVVGEASGGHSGVVVPHSDDRGASYLPDAPFQPGESVTVRAELLLETMSEESVTFTVARPVAPPKTETSRDADKPKAAPRSFRSRPDLRPPVVAVTTAVEGTAPGYVFLGVRPPDGQNGAMILDDDGELVWFRPMSVDVAATYDVRVQQYRGQPVLTWSEGVAGQGYGFGHFVMCDDAYQEVALLRVGNGYYGGDVHEFLLTPRGTALIMVYNAVRWDLSSVGGAEDGTALDGIIQEIDVETGRVLFEWHSLDHIDLDESHREPTSEVGEQFDYVHLNSVQDDGDGNLIICARHTDAIYKVDRRTGEIVWRLNGKRSDFTMGEGTQTAFHHDARVHPNGDLTLFDNAAGEPGADARSRGVVLELDTQAMTATLVREYIHPTNILSVSQGNFQVLPNGNVFVGWGSAPVLSEFGPDGELLFNARFPAETTSYRAYRLPWTGRPSEPPDIAAEFGDGDTVTVYASWNGSTVVASWQVVAGPAPDQMRPVGLAKRRTGFETTIPVQTSEPYLAAHALDSSGQIIGISSPITPSD